MIRLLVGVLFATWVFLDLRRFTSAPKFVAAFYALHAGLVLYLLLYISADVEAIREAAEQ